MDQKGWEILSLQYCYLQVACQEDLFAIEIKWVCIFKRYSLLQKVSWKLNSFHCHFREKNLLYSWLLGVHFKCSRKRLKLFWYSTHVFTSREFKLCMAIIAGVYMLTTRQYCRINATSAKVANSRKLKTAWKGKFH